MAGRVKRKAGLAVAQARIHATLPNADLAREYAAPGALPTHPTIARYLRWIADKPADFHAPVRRARVA